MLFPSVDPIFLSETVLHIGLWLLGLGLSAARGEQEEEGIVVLVKRGNAPVVVFVTVVTVRPGSSHPLASPAQQ